MSEKIKVISINDGGIDKKFVLHKFGAMNLVRFNHKLLGTLEGLKDLNSNQVANIRQIFFSILQSGEQDENAEIKSISVIEIIPAAMNILRSILSSSSSKLQDEVLTEIFNHVSYINDGINPLKLSMDPTSLQYIDHHVDDMESIYRISWEVLKFNYEGSYNRFFRKAEQKNTSIN